MSVRRHVWQKWRLVVTAATIWQKVAPGTHRCHFCQKWHLTLTGATLGADLSLCRPRLLLLGHCPQRFVPFSSSTSSHPAPPCTLQSTVLLEGGSHPPLACEKVKALDETHGPDRPLPLLIQIYKKTTHSLGSGQQTEPRTRAEPNRAKYTEALSRRGWPRQQHGPPVQAAGATPRAGRGGEGWVGAGERQAATRTCAHDTQPGPAGSFTRHQGKIHTPGHRGHTHNQTATKTLVPCGHLPRGRSSTGQT